MSEEELRQGVRFVLGAAAAAAARKLKDRLRGQTVVLIVSGGNITVDQLRRVLADTPAW